LVLVVEAVAAMLLRDRKAVPVAVDQPQIQLGLVRVSPVKETTAV